MDWLYLHKEYWNICFVNGNFDIVPCVVFGLVALLGTIIALITLYCDYFSKIELKDWTILHLLLILLSVFVSINVLYFNLYALRYLVPILVVIYLCYLTSKVKIGHLLVKLPKYKIKFEKK